MTLSKLLLFIFLGIFLSGCASNTEKIKKELLSEEIKRSFQGFELIDPKEVSPQYLRENKKLKENNGNGNGESNKTNYKKCGCDHSGSIEVKEVNPNSLQQLLNKSYEGSSYKNGSVSLYASYDNNEKSQIESHFISIYQSSPSDPRSFEYKLKSSIDKFYSSHTNSKIPQGTQALIQFEEDTSIRNIELIKTDSMSVNDKNNLSKHLQHFKLNALVKLPAYQGRPIKNIALIW